MNKKIKLIFGLLLTGLALPSLTAAATSKTLLGTLDTVAGNGGYQTTGVTTAGIIGLVLGAFVGFLGITFIVLTIIAGYSWMTAQGNEETIKKSMATIKGSLIGLVICLAAFSLWKFIFQKLILGA